MRSFKTDYHAVIFKLFQSSKKRITKTTFYHTDWINKMTLSKNIKIVYWPWLYFYIANCLDIACVFVVYLVSSKCQKSHVAFVLKVCDFYK